MGNKWRSRLFCHYLVIWKKHSMPELPEVNTVQRYFDEVATGQRIEEVVVHDGHIIRNLSPDAFAERLTGRTFSGSYRRGKFLFAGLDNGHHVQLHLGMSGDLAYYTAPEDEPKFCRFHFLLGDGGRLAFDCPRKLARILYIENLEAYIHEKQLGEDALRIGEDQFLQMMDGRSGTLKGFLMNQRHLAGIGNLYADEICYQAEVHPASETGRIGTAKRRLLFRKMREILTFAVEKNAHYRKYPSDWLWKWRKEGHAGPDGKGEVQKMTIAGRTTYFLPEIQTRY